MKKSISKWIILAVAVLINAFILVNASINGTISAQESGSLSRFFASIINAFSPNAINEANFDNFAYVVRKLVGHFALFGLDGIFSTLSFFLFLKDSKWNNGFIIAGASSIFGLLVAAISEMIQIFTPDRYGTWGDIGIDFGGYFLGLALTILVLYFAKYISFKKKQNV